jgi:hypothetical protein
MTTLLARNPLSVRHPRATFLLRARPLLFDLVCWVTSSIGKPGGNSIVSALAHGALQSSPKIESASFTATWH